jgi:Family of unknown function (DUF6932)
MPVPAFNIDGVIPPFSDPSGPGGAPHYMTPYGASSAEIVTGLGSSKSRKKILIGWLEHRRLLRDIGIVSGFQWLDGSFVENKEPNDLDIVTFFRRPAAKNTVKSFRELVNQNANIFKRPSVKQNYRLDSMFVDLDGTSEAIVDSTRYWLGLFSHRRVDYVWKGILKVSLADPSDDDAVELLKSEPNGDASTLGPLVAK